MKMYSLTQTENTSSSHRRYILNIRIKESEHGTRHNLPGTKIYQKYIWSGSGVLDQPLSGSMSIILNTDLRHMKRDFTEETAQMPFLFFF